jgi:hypothetical protein
VCGETVEGTLAPINDDSVEQDQLTEPVSDPVGDAKNESATPRTTSAPKLCPTSTASVSSSDSITATTS